MKNNGKSLISQIVRGCCLAKRISRLPIKLNLFCFFFWHSEIKSECNYRETLNEKENLNFWANFKVVKNKPNPFWKCVLLRKHFAADFSLISLCNCTLKMLLKKIRQFWSVWLAHVSLWELRKNPYFLCIFMTFLGIGGTINEMSVSFCVFCVSNEVFDHFIATNMGRI